MRRPFCSFLLGCVGLNMQGAPLQRDGSGTPAARHHCCKSQGGACRYRHQVRAAAFVPTEQAHSRALQIELGPEKHFLATGTGPAMPRPRPRPAPCDCLECREPATPSSAPVRADAAARQDPPPRLLLIFADGFLQALEAASAGPASLAHLNAHVREGSLGMLAARESTAGRSGAPSVAERLAELTQLFGLQASICWLHVACFQDAQIVAEAVAAKSRCASERENPAVSEMCGMWQDAVPCGAEEAAAEPATALSLPHR